MSTYKCAVITGTTPAAASTAIGNAVFGLDKYDEITIDADLVGATGGVLDVYLQREVDTDVWRDWCHFTQLTAGGAAVKYTVTSGSGAAAITAVGVGAAASATPVLAAGSILSCHPGRKLRAVYVAGVSTSAGAAVTIRVTGRMGVK